MTLSAAARNLAAAGVSLIGITGWVLSATGSIGSRPGAAFLGVTLGGGLVMTGLALSLMPGRRIRRHCYFDG